MIALGAADLRGAPEWLIALLGAVLVLARVSHADGLTRTGASPFVPLASQAPSRCSWCRASRDCS